MTSVAHRLPSPTATLALALALVLLLAGNVAAAVTHRAELRIPYAQDDLLTILVIGSDVGWPPRPGDELRGRADAIHLLAVDTQARRATIVSMPRDSLIGGTKVNAHLASGGPERLVAQVQSYSGVEIDHWALTTFHGLRRMVTELDGVEIEVERSMTATGSDVTLQPGPQRLNPDEALGFTRDRKSQPRGDFDRTANQAKLLLAVQTQLREERSNLVDLARLGASFIRDTHTSIPRSEVVRLGVLATQIDPADVLLVPLSGSIGTGAGGASIVNLAPGDAFERIREGHTGP